MLKDTDSSSASANHTGGVYLHHINIWIQTIKEHKKHTVSNYCHSNIGVWRTVRVLRNVSEMQSAIKGSMQGLGLSPLQRAHLFCLNNTGTCHSMYWQCLSIRSKQITQCANLNFLWHSNITWPNPSEILSSTLPNHKKKKKVVFP